MAWAELRLCSSSSTFFVLNLALLSSSCASSISLLNFPSFLFCSYIALSKEAAFSYHSVDILIWSFCLFFISLSSSSTASFYNFKWLMTLVWSRPFFPKSSSYLFSSLMIDSDPDIFCTFSSRVSLRVLNFFNSFWALSRCICSSFATRRASWELSFSFLSFSYHSSINFCRFLFASVKLSHLLISSSTLLSPSINFC